jgi:hypothetical protein
MVHWIKTAKRGKTLSLLEHWRRGKLGTPACMDGAEPKVKNGREQTPCSGGCGNKEQCIRLLGPALRFYHCLGAWSSCQASKKEKKTKKFSFDVEDAMQQRQPRLHAPDKVPSAVRSRLDWAGWFQPLER